MRRKPQRVFERDEIVRLLDNAGNYHVLLATSVFSGLRLMELLGLRWADIDFDDGYINVRHQLSRKGVLKGLKSDAGERSVVLFPELARKLREHKAASRYSQPQHYAFTSATGRHLHWRNVETRGFDAAVTRAKLTRDEGAKPVLHDLRQRRASRQGRRSRTPGSSGRARARRFGVLRQAFGVAPRGPRGPLRTCGLPGRAHAGSARRRGRGRRAV